MAAALLQEGMLQFRPQLMRLLVHSPARAPLKKSQQLLLLDLPADRDCGGELTSLFTALTQIKAYFHAQLIYSIFL